MIMMSGAGKRVDCVCDLFVTDLTCLVGCTDGKVAAGWKDEKRSLSVTD